MSALESSLRFNSIPGASAGPTCAPDCRASYRPRLSEGSLVLCQRVGSAHGSRIRVERAAVGQTPGRALCHGSGGAGPSGRRRGTPRSCGSRTEVRRRPGPEIRQTQGAASRIRLCTSFTSGLRHAELFALSSPSEQPESFFARTTFERAGQKRTKIWTGTSPKILAAASITHKIPAKGPCRRRGLEPPTRGL